MRLFSVIAAFLLLMTSWGIAQGPLKHEKKIYVAPDGKMYIQRDLPVYIRLSTSPNENAKSYLLKSEQTAKYSNPMYFDTEGYNTVRSPSAVDTVTHKTIYPLQDIIFEVYTDSEPPVTTMNFGNTNLYKKEGKYYCKGGIDITLESKDDGSGTEKIYFSVNGNPFQPYLETLNYKEEKEYVISYYSVDNVGNVEDIKSKTFLVDIKNPQTTIDIEGPSHENIVSFRSKIILESSDNISGVSKIMYKIDQGHIKKYVGSIKMVGMPQGEHILSYFSSDNVGNSENEKQYAFYVDNLPPILIEELMGNTIDINGSDFTSGRTKLKLTAKDNKAGVKAVYYSINGGGYKTYDKPFYLSENSGKLAIKCYTVDNVENKSNWSNISEKTGIPYFDLEGPLLTFRLSGNSFKYNDTTYINQETKIDLLGRDKEAGLNRIEYVIDNKESKKFDASFIIQEEGFHEVTYNGYDNVGNSNMSTIKFIVDNTGPEIQYQFSTVPINSENRKTKASIYPSHVVLFFSSIDRRVGFDKMYYSINGSAEILYSGLIKKFLKGKDYHIKVMSKDKLGNKSIEEVKFSIEI